MQELASPQHHLGNQRVLRTMLVILSAATLSGVIFSAGYFSGQYVANKQYEKKLALIDVKGVSEEKTYPLLKYSFSELAKRGGIPSEITIIRELEKNAEFTSYVFYFTSEGRKISGQLNIPALATVGEASPVILMMRGYVDPAEYTIGKGTSPSAAAFARAGYITFAPDFLGFGESDPPPGETLAERFIKPMNVLDLFATIDAFDQQPLVFQNKQIAKVDAKRLGLWAHSNGGQISLSFLEITGRAVPTVLLAPVTKSFPYSVLYFTDEAEDQGRGLRALLAKFEQDYNIEQFSIGNRLDDVTAKIQLHQGSKDAEVPQRWSDEFYSHFAGKGKKDQIEYFVYEGADHLLIPATETVKQRAVEFFNREVKNKLPEPTPTPTELPIEAPDLVPNSTLPATTTIPRVTGNTATVSATPVVTDIPTVR